MNKIKIINTSLIIMGTSVGAGMLGLPVETGKGGFLPSLIFSHQLACNDRDSAAARGGTCKG